MWSSVAAVLAFVGVAAAFTVGGDEEPLALSPRVVGVDGTAAGSAVALGAGRRVYRWLRRADDFAIDRDRGAPTVDGSAAEAPEPPTDVWRSLPRF